MRMLLHMPVINKKVTREDMRPGDSGIRMATSIEVIIGGAAFQPGGGEFPA